MAEFSDERGGKVLAALMRVPLRRREVRVERTELPHRIEHDRAGVQRASHARRLADGPALRRRRNDVRAIGGTSSPE